MNQVQVVRYVRVLASGVTVPKLLQTFDWSLHASCQPSVTIRTAVEER